MTVIDLSQNAVDGNSAIPTTMFTVLWPALNRRWHPQLTEDATLVLSARNEDRHPTVQLPARCGAVRGERMGLAPGLGGKAHWILELLAHRGPDLTGSPLWCWNQGECVPRRTGPHRLSRTPPRLRWPPWLPPRPHRPVPPSRRHRLLLGAWLPREQRLQAPERSTRQGPQPPACWRRARLA